MKERCKLNNSIQVGWIARSEHRSKAQHQSLFGSGQSFAVI